jgi:hypothetical protein
MGGGDGDVSVFFPVVEEGVSDEAGWDSSVDGMSFFGNNDAPLVTALMYAYSPQVGKFDSEEPEKSTVNPNRVFMVSAVWGIKGVRA